MKCQNCKKKLEEGEKYKLVDKKPVCKGCWDVYEEHLKEARDWLGLHDWDNQDILIMGGIKMKIHCVESKKKDFDKIPINEVRKMVGWIEPPEKEDEDEIWDVTLANGDGFECKNQTSAQILASVEEIKALLLEKIKNE